MSRQLQLTTAPLWKLAGFALLLLSFSFTGWMLGHAVIAVDHLIDALVDFVQNSTPFLQSHGQGLSIG